MTSPETPRGKRRAPDPRPSRTREALFGALLELIQEKRWDQIRVQDVLDRTGIGRSTFYAHFDNKFDLLTGAIPAATLSLADSDDDFPDLRPLFDHVEEMQPILRPLMSQPLLAEITQAFQAQLVTAWRTHLERTGVPAQRCPIAADILSGALMAVLQRWLADRCAQPPGEITADFERHARPIVETARDS